MNVPFAKCMFLLLEWNKLCMQKELDKSLDAKKLKPKLT